MKRIKIALLLASMDSGGIEKAAVSLLRALPEAEFDVHLILNRKKGVFLKLVPDWVRISELCKSEKYNKRVELGDRKWLVYSLAHLDLASVFNAITHFVYSKFATLDKAIMCRIKQLSKEVKYSIPSRLVISELLTSNSLISLTSDKYTTPFGFCTNSRITSKKLLSVNEDSIE